MKKKQPEQPEVIRKTEKQIEKDIIKSMKSIGNYDKAYKYAIETLAMTIYELETNKIAYHEQGGNSIVEYTNKFGATNETRNPLLITIEKLRSDVFTMSKELGLTPGSNKNSNKQDNTPKNEVVEFLMKKK